MTYMDEYARLRVATTGQVDVTAAGLGYDRKTGETFPLPERVTTPDQAALVGGTVMPTQVVGGLQALYGGMV